MKSYLAFDIESRPRPDLVDRFIKPASAFDEAACLLEYTTARDPVKGPAFLQKKREDHAAEQAAKLKQAHDKAALNPLTAEVCVIGIILPDGIVEHLEGPETNMLAGFWDMFSDFENASTRFVFWSGCGDPGKAFDIDFLTMRSRILGVPLPPLLRNGRYYSPRIVDLASEFLLYQREAYMSLTTAADVLGLYDVEEFGLSRKQDTDLVTGKDFWRWYDGVADAIASPEVQRVTALGYLNNDLEHTRRIADRIL
jgi:hypothetical protein